MIFKPPKFSISFNIIEILTLFLVLLQYLISILLRIFPLLFLRAIMCHHWICPLRWSTGLLEKETRFKGWLLRHTTTPRKKPYITAVDEICLGDCRWNGTSQRGKGKIFTGWSSSASHNVALFQVQTQPRTKSMLKWRTNGEQVKVLSLWVGKKHGVNLELRDKKYFY